MSHSGYAPRIKAIRITDMILPGPKCAEPDSPEIRQHREQHILDAIAREAQHECEYGEPGVCPSCTRKRRPVRGSKRWLRIEKIRAGLRAELNGAGEDVDDG